MMGSLSISQIFHCKKIRRSCRLESKEKAETFEKRIKDGPLGYFEILPLELKFHLLSYIPVEDLSMLTISSKNMRNLIEVYRLTNNAKRHLMSKPLTHTVMSIRDQITYVEQFKKLGLLMKRSTCLYTTKDRLRIVERFLSKYLCGNADKCTDPTHCIALVCFGKFLHTVLNGWDDMELIRTFETMSINSYMWKNLGIIVNSKPGSNPKHEYHARLFYRRVFLDQVEKVQDRIFWITRILKPWPMVHQARLLFLLYGPVSAEEIQWYDVCENCPANRHQAKLCFGDIADILRLLHTQGKEWSEDDIISVLDEITSSPDDWLAENVAHLLFQCGDQLTLKVMGSKAVNGRLAELASIITSLCLVCIKQDCPMTWVTAIVHRISSILDSSKDKQMFMSCIIDTFREVIIDLHEFSVDADEDRDIDFQYVLDAQSEFLKEMLSLSTGKPT
ncbi:unnamed protein product [Owenia fusiformis]|uniref:FBXO47 ARM repeats region domain-containing protein n=1 Tax=Owenia fusiformis TaxID=6347 RepID=A0A8J1U2I2_OWEFU|nr:unnamed protein product [Owenia fusiformis]